MTEEDKSTKKCKQTLCRDTRTERNPAEVVRAAACFSVSDYHLGASLKPIVQETIEIRDV